MPALVVGMLACAGGAGAASAPPMTVTVEQPSGATENYFDVSAQAGQTTTAGSLVVRNQTGKQITVLLDPVCGLTASTLGSAYGLRGCKAGAAKWVVLGQQRVVLAPHAGTRVSVSVRVPSGAGPGDYLAGIGVQAGGPASEVELEGNVAISQVQRYAVGLVTSLPGPRNPSIKLTGVALDREPAGVTFKVRGRNNGNVILQNVKGSATISEGDDLVARRTLGPGTFVTDTSISYPLLVPSLQPSEGTAYQVEAVLRYPGGVARIDRVVQFGEIDAMRQQQYGGPQVSGEDGGNKLLPILLIVAAIAAGLVALRFWRRRGQSGESALHRALPRQIAHARASGEPLSVILVPGDGGRSPRELANVVQGSLRSRDQLFRPNGSGLMIVSPDTTPEAGEMLATEIRRALARSGNGTATVIPITSAAESSAEELLEAAAAIGADEAEAANGDATNGDASNGDPANGARHQGRLEQSSQDEVKHSGTEAPAVGSRDRTHRA